MRVLKTIAQIYQFGPGTRHCRPAKLQEWNACRRQRYDRRDRPPQDLRGHAHAKRPRNGDTKPRSESQNERMASSATDAQRMHSPAGGGRRARPLLKADRPHDRESDPCAPTQGNSGFAQDCHKYHPPHACKLDKVGKFYGASTRGGHNHVYPARNHQSGPSGGPHDRSQGSHLRSRRSKNADTAHSGRGSFSSSPPAREYRMRRQSDNLHPDVGAADSPQALQFASVAGDLRQRSIHDYGPSRVSPHSHR